MELLRHYLRIELRQFLASGTRLTVIGRRDRLPQGLREEITRAEAPRPPARRVHLQIAFDYSSRAAIANAAAGWLADDSPSRNAFLRLLSWQGGGNGAEVDLLIRSGGEKRLSDFLLWECAYAELCFVETLWPHFGAHHPRAASAERSARERRCGGLCNMPARDAAQ